MKTKRYLFIPAILIFATSSLIPGQARAATGEKEKDEPTLSLLNFTAAVLFVDQGNSQNTYTGQVSWTPSFRLMEDLSLSGDFGATLLKGSGISNFAAFHYEAFLGYRFLNSLEIQGGGGMQTYVNSGTSGIVTGRLQYLFSTRSLFVIDRIFGQYSRFFAPVADNEYALGVGISF